MRINEDILRYLTLRVDEMEEGPSAIMRNKDRDDRPRRGGDRGDRGPRRDFGGDRPKKPEDDSSEPTNEAAKQTASEAPATEDKKGDEA